MEPTDWGWDWGGGGRYTSDCLVGTGWVGGLVATGGPWVGGRAYWVGG